MRKSKDDLKGRFKKAVGDLTDNDRLRREGQADQAGAKVKDAAQKLKDKVDGAVDDVKDKLRK